MPHNGVYMVVLRVLLANEELSAVASRREAAGTCHILFSKFK